MGDQSFSELKANPINPRSISKQQHEALRAGLAEFGDLGAFVYNRQLDRIVSGHQRREAFERMGGDKEIIITTNFDTPTPDGTVALGYIKHNDNFYSYRIVDWPEAKDLAAMTAANRISGDWELEGLADVNAMIKQLDESMLALTGQTDAELKRLEQLGNEPEHSDPAESDNQMVFKLTGAQSEIVNDALMTAMRLHEFDLAANSDRNGNALYYICVSYMKDQNANTETEQPTSASPPE